MTKYKFVTKNKVKIWIVVTKQTINDIFYV